eukprot:1181975-Prorocentrum_minimum.AAC.2
MKKDYARLCEIMCCEILTNLSSIGSVSDLASRNFSTASQVGFVWLFFPALAASRAEWRECQQ